MSLYEALQRRGYSFRQHLEEVGWTARKLTVVDLDAAQRTALDQQGTEGLKRVLESQGLWSFPAMDIEKPLPASGDLVLAEAGTPRAVVVAPKSGVLQQMAEEFVAHVATRCGVRLPILDADATDLALPLSQHVLLFGGAHESRFAMDLALRIQSAFVDATVPGEEGWVVTTHAGLDASGYRVMQVAASASTRREALACLCEAVVRHGESTRLRATHRICPGALMRQHLPSWEEWTAGLPHRIPRFQGRRVVAPQDPVALANLLAEGLDSGGPHVNFYNAAPIDIAVQAAQYYQRTADPRALQLFRELLFRLADYYLKTPGGASYPSDFDFRLGHLILYYARLEHHPLFSEEDRLILTNLLLACSRSIYEYAQRHWPIRPEVPTRHNHETFPARSLMFAADYFDRYGIADTAQWRTYVEDTFRCEMWHRYKQRENANHYEMLAFEHAATYSAFTGHRLDLFDRECLRWAAYRHVITTDNFLRPVDYGDSSPAMHPGHADHLAVIFTSQYEDVRLQEFAHACFQRHPAYLPGALESFPGVRRGAPQKAIGETSKSFEDPQAGKWELLPLDPRFAATYAPGFPREYAFDKLAFRSGWGDEDHYLLLEGVGHEKISHSHLDPNGVVRLNHLGRHWIVSNGYGRRAGLTNVAQSFNTRVRGPEDHNTLVLHRDGQIVREVPPFSALLQRGQSGPLAYATSALLGYSGVDWFRTLLILANRFVVVLDRVRIAASGLEGAHIEWNGLGEVAEQSNGFRLAQHGVFLHVASGSGWPAEVGVSDQSADWKRILESKAYPYADWPLKKLLFKVPSVAPGSVAAVAVLFSATRSPAPAYRIAEPASGVIHITPSQEALPEVAMEADDLSIQVRPTLMEIRFAPTPALPEALKRWAAQA